VGKTEKHRSVRTAFSPGHFFSWNFLKKKKTKNELNELISLSVEEKREGHFGSGDDLARVVVGHRHRGERRARRVGTGRNRDGRIRSSSGNLCITRLWLEGGLALAAAESRRTNIAVGRLWTGAVAAVVH